MRRRALDNCNCYEQRWLFENVLSSTVRAYCAQVLVGQEMSRPPSPNPSSVSHLSTSHSTPVRVRKTPEASCATRPPPPPPEVCAELPSPPPAHLGLEVRALRALVAVGEGLRAGGVQGDAQRAHEGPGAPGAGGDLEGGALGRVGAAARGRLLQAVAAAALGAHKRLVALALQQERKLQHVCAGHHPAPSQGAETEPARLSGSRACRGKAPRYLKRR